MKASELRNELHHLADPGIAQHSRRFFKTGPGEYGEGDEFLGIRVPELRKMAGRYQNMPLAEVEKVLRSRYHEERLTALFILEKQFPKASENQKKNIYRFYLKNLEYINNWDLIDSSAPKITGAYLYDKPRDQIYEWAGTDNLWKRRIAVISTFYFIKQGDTDDTFRIAALLLHDKHDLIHKATGWMLREAGKKNPQQLEDFLNRYYRQMPRTMLRYGIEKLPEEVRKAYLKK